MPLHLSFASMCFRHPPSLRGALAAKQSHGSASEAMDCFAALAMTGSCDQAPIAIFGSASAFAFISFSARRYSTGVTLRNFGSQAFQLARISAALFEPVSLAWR